MLIASDIETVLNNLIFQQITIIFYVTVGMINIIYTANIP